MVLKQLVASYDVEIKMIVMAVTEILGHEHKIGYSFSIYFYFIVWLLGCYKKTYYHRQPSLLNSGLIIKF